MCMLLHVIPHYIAMLASANAFHGLYIYIFNVLKIVILLSLERAKKKAAFNSTLCVI